MKQVVWELRSSTTDAYLSLPDISWKAAQHTQTDTHAAHTDTHAAHTDTHTAHTAHTHTHTHTSQPDAAYRI